MNRAIWSHYYLILHVKYLSNFDSKLATPKAQMLITYSKSAEEPQQFLSFRTGQELCTATIIKPLIPSNVHPLHVFKIQVTIAIFSSPPLDRKKVVSAISCTKIPVYFINCMTDLLPSCMQTIHEDDFLSTYTVSNGAQLVEWLYVEPGAFISSFIQGHPHGILL